jgi:hypothetical protein
LHIAKTVGVELDVQTDVDNLVYSPNATKLVLAQEVEPYASPHTPGDEG